MNRADLVRAIADKTGESLRSGEAMVKSFTQNVTQSVARGDKVGLVGFGSFSATKRKTREGRNPATGAKIKIPAKKVPKFIPAKAFRDKVGK